MEVLGLDIGGANLKAAHTDGTAKTVPFALWRAPQELPARLDDLIKQFSSFDQLAVTMTGELCDCFETKRQGVAAILQSVEQVAGKTPIRVWSHRGRLVTVAQANSNPVQVASANWHAQATFAARLTSDPCAVLLDIGSTTTDLIPIVEGKAAPRGLTDPQRLLSHELCYTGVRRTPLCSLLEGQCAAEFFATMLDAYLVLGETAEDEQDTDTADGRPALRIHALNRMARMVCGDRETLDEEDIVGLAENAVLAQIGRIANCLDHVVLRMPEPPGTILVSGSGQFIHQEVIEESQTLEATTVVSLADQLGAALSSAACAYAVAVLAKEEPR